MDVSKLKRLRAGTAGRLVVAAATTARWADGKVLISSARAKEIVSSSDARLLQVLHAFARPRLVAEVSGELQQLGEGFLFASVAALWDAGMLVAADEDEKSSIENASEERSEGAEETGEDEGDRHDAVAAASNLLAHEQAEKIARLIRQIACDLAGFGIDAHETESASESGVGLLTRLGDAERALSVVASELENRRAPHLASQLARLGVSPASKNLRLHLGSGATRLEGWINVDIPPADLTMHLGWALPFADASVEYIYLSHVLEHLSREEAAHLLSESQRVLAPGGVLRVVVPDMEKALRAYTEADEEFFAARKKLWPNTSRACHTPLQHILKIAGAGARPASFWGHKYGYDFETLKYVLARAGFDDVERSEYMQSTHAPLRVDTTGKTSGFKYRERFYSLFVEATK